MISRVKGIASINQCAWIAAVVRKFLKNILEPGRQFAKIKASEGLSSLPFA